MAEPLITAAREAKVPIVEIGLNHEQQHQELILTDILHALAQNPTSLELRLLETVVEVAAEKNSTLVLPFPVELLRFLEKSTDSLRPATRTTVVR